MVARIENSGVLVRPTMTAPACSRWRTIGASSRAMTWARPATPFGVRWPRTSTLSLMVIGTPKSGPAASPCARRVSSRSAAAIAVSPRSSVTAFRRGLTACSRSTAATATSRHDSAPAPVAATISVAVHCQRGRSGSRPRTSSTQSYRSGRGRRNPLSPRRRRTSSFFVLPNSSPVPRLAPLSSDVSGGETQARDVGRPHGRDRRRAAGGATVVHRRRQHPPADHRGRLARPGRTAARVARARRRLRHARQARIDRPLRRRRRTPRRGAARKPASRAAGPGGRARAEPGELRHADADRPRLRHLQADGRHRRGAADVDEHGVGAAESRAGR